ncbi:hypothetical protein ZWY2020_014971 [Hordeum vulgare]|nr:hypothetical protein ZWY2020_014971 [Hordeum vulgare]
MADQAAAMRRWAALALAAALGAVYLLLLLVALSGGAYLAGISVGTPRSDGTAASTAKVVVTAAASDARRWLRDSTPRLAATAR